MKLIDKDALVAEIERLKEQDYPCDTFEESTGYYNALDEITTFLNTLEVKEVDLEKETDKWYNTKASKEFENVFYDDIEECAKYFFELGLKAQQNINIDITNIDKVMEENGVDLNSKEAKVFKESYYIALEKFKSQRGKQ